MFFVAVGQPGRSATDSGAPTSSTDAEDELVRRYQRRYAPTPAGSTPASPCSWRLIAASGTIGEWQNWILFTHGADFAGKTDPQFATTSASTCSSCRSWTFVVNWMLVSLVVMLVVTAVFHYLNGGIRAQRVSPGCARR